MRYASLLLFALCFGDLVFSQPLELPLIDDFSNPDLSWNQTLWDQENSSCHLNRNRSVHPPSVGVMSFDGIDKEGFYFVESAKDYLISKNLDLSNYAQNSIYLSFFIQFGGYGNTSSSVESSFHLFMYNSSGEKVLLTKWEEQDFARQDSFYYFSLEVPKEFVHSQTKILFEVQSNDPMDYNDSWHLDYLSIEEFEPPGFSFDISFSNEPTSLLKKYASMPFSQFYVRPSQMLSDSFFLDFYNHFPYKEKMLEDLLLITSVEEEGESFSTAFLQKIPDVTSNQNFLNSGNTYYHNPTAEKRLEEYFLEFSPNKNQIFNLSYSYQQDEEILFGAETFLKNNSVNQILEFGDRYRLDDQSYEESYFIQQRPEATSPGISVEFETFLDDKLRGFEIVLMNTLNQESFEFDFSVYLDTLDSDPIFTAENVRLSPNYDIDQQIFLPVSYLFRENNQSDLTIPHGKFYLTFSIRRENKNQFLAFGFDRSSYHGFPNLYFRGSVNNNWRLQEGKKFEGYAMIHPIMANQTDITTSISDLAENVIKYAIYPNPSNGLITIDALKNSKLGYISIKDVLGRTVYPLTKIESEKVTLPLDGRGLFTVSIYDQNLVLMTSKKIFNY